ncbi:rSAM/selenodomain-associated transferase 2 [Saonia flava]|uniref:RSAM/selenodomain-associated transferase 2 n=1 Tax=Saonia flava TaxID=523696 RepID=A0A846R4Z7_9FLAO|nr:TIGR04283 family arsenosugar biosynthesis glycosyltransferase [Saonia flava]NJB71869.1 rSAM/selenodomain-associated transferase 2 [Saonia flava]
MKKSNPVNISIIIPVLNEEENIGKLLSYIKNNSSPKNIKEILVVDGGSKDKTVTISNTHAVNILHSEKGRPIQMNLGAKNAKGDILYFLHADTLPPKNFDESIVKAVKSGYNSGCFRMCFDTKNPFLRFFAALTRLNHKICRGGDQSLFVKKSIFNQLNGYNESYLIYEDTEFIGRLYGVTNFIVLPEKVITSARKYRKNGAFRLQFHFGMIHLKNLLGANPKELHSYYKKHILE